MTLDLEESVREAAMPAIIDTQARGEIDMQITTAKRYPRSLTGFEAEATTMATYSESVAASCIYALPRGGKSIEGPSARLAEIVASAWGNCRAGARIVHEDERFVTAQGTFYDLQRNVAITFEVRRRITDSHNRRYNDDMITVTGNAAASIALRNAVFKGIPKAFWEPVYVAARAAAVGDIKTIAARRAQLVEYFGKMGMPAERIYATLGIEGLKDIGERELLLLRGAATAIKDGELKIDDAFPPIIAAVESQGSRSDALAEKLRAAHQAPAQIEPPVAAQPEAPPEPEAPELPAALDAAALDAQQAEQPGLPLDKPKGKRS